MSKSDGARYRFCEKLGRAVLIEQTEGQCRDQHNCGDFTCPLETSFSQDSIDRSLSLLAPALLEGVPRK